MKKDVRVLTPKELWQAMGFPQDYTIEKSGREKEFQINICLTEFRGLCREREKEWPSSVQ